jgi:hypothetical protein
MKNKTWLSFVVLAVGVAAHSRGATVYRESASGDLSNSGITPTVLPVSLGSNQIFGTTGRVTATDRDYFAITVPTGLQISQIVGLGKRLSETPYPFSVSNLRFAKRG